MNSSALTVIRILLLERIRLIFPTARAAASATALYLFLGGMILYFIQDIFRTATSNSQTITIAMLLMTMSTAVVFSTTLGELSSLLELLKKDYSFSGNALPIGFNIIVLFTVSALESLLKTLIVTIPVSIVILAKFNTSPLTCLVLMACYLGAAIISATVIMVGNLAKLPLVGRQFAAAFSFLVVLGVLYFASSTESNGSLLNHLPITGTINTLSYAFDTVISTSTSSIAFFAVMFVLIVLCMAVSAISLRCERLSSRVAKVRPLLRFNFGTHVIFEKEWKSFIRNPGSLAIAFFRTLYLLVPCLSGALLYRQFSFMAGYIAYLVCETSSTAAIQFFKDDFSNISIFACPNYAGLRNSKIAITVVVSALIVALLYGASCLWFGGHIEFIIALIMGFSGGTLSGVLCVIYNCPRLVIGQDVNSSERLSGLSFGLMLLKGSIFITTVVFCFYARRF